MEIIEIMEIMETTGKSPRDPGENCRGIRLIFNP
jgi:hypothetical protein